MQIRADYQRFDLDDEGSVSWVGDRMNAKLMAMQGIGLPGDFAAHKSLLDVGCDHGFWSFLMASQGGARAVLGLDRGREVKGIGPVDLVAKNNAIARQFEIYDRVHFRSINLGAQFHEFGQFDSALCMSVYHHIYAQCGDHRAVWFWLARHVKPGGCLVWESPVDVSDPVIQRNVPQHLHANYTFDKIVAAAQRHFILAGNGPAEHEPTRQIWVLWRRLGPAGVVINKATRAGGSGGASKAFLRNDGQRMDEIEAALGVRPIPGSLNLNVETNQAPNLDQDYYRVQISDTTDRSNPDAPWAPRWCRFYPTAIAGVSTHAMRFEGERYPVNFIELISPHKLGDLLSPSPIIKRGNFYYPATDTKCWPAVMRDAKRDIDSVLASCAGRGLIVQAGGNVGVYPQMLAEHFGKVVTVEPDSVNVFCMRQNVTAPNVQIVVGALGSDGFPVTIERFADNCGASRVTPLGGDIPCIRIDDLGLEACDMIWLDVEGSEREALMGAAETIRKFHPLIRFEQGSAARRRGIADGVISEWLATEFYYRVLGTVGRDVVMAWEDRQ